MDATACAFVDLDILSENKQQVGSNQTQRTELRLIFDDLETEREVNFLLYYHYLTGHYF